jgi:hypothetical protein
VSHNRLQIPAAVDDLAPPLLEIGVGARHFGAHRCLVDGFGEAFGKHDFCGFAAFLGNYLGGDIAPVHGCQFGH